VSGKSLHGWQGATQGRKGEAGSAIVTQDAACKLPPEGMALRAALQRDSFCLSGYLHDEEAERFGRLIRPILAETNRGHKAATETGGHS
jgi:alkanesulfonate monooxygenase